MTSAYKRKFGLPKLKDQMSVSGGSPYTGFTQGGSSRRGDRGAERAAVGGNEKAFAGSEGGAAGEEKADG